MKTYHEIIALEGGWIARVYHDGKIIEFKGQAETREECVTAAKQHVAKWRSDNGFSV